MPAKCIIEMMGLFAILRQKLCPHTLIKELLNSYDLIQTYYKIEHLFCRYQQVKFWEAKKDYEQALLLNPAEGAFHYNLSTILYRMGDYRSALEGFEKAVAISPCNPEFSEALTSCQKRVQLK